MLGSKSRVSHGLHSHYTLMLNFYIEPERTRGYGANLAIPRVRLGHVGMVCEQAFPQRSQGFAQGRSDLLEMV